MQIRLAERTNKRKNGR